MMSLNRVALNFGVVALLTIAGCYSQTPQPVVEVVSRSSPSTPSTPLTSLTPSTPLPPTFPSASPYFNAFRPPFYPQQYAGGPQPFIGGPNVVPQPFIGGPNVVPQPFIGGPNILPQPFIGGPNVVPQPSGPQFIGAPNAAIPQRFVNGPNSAYAFVPILQQTFDITPEGSYTFSYQSADGTQRQESGGLKYPGVPGYPPVLSVQGSYASITPEGVPIEVTYIADENGYQPSGPGIHPAIQRAVAQQVAQAKQEQQQPQPQLIKK